jgi:hypothetical protein
MRRLNHPRHHLQPDLFRPGSPKLEWRQLPTEARGKATRLMARMLQERQYVRPDEEPAGGHDDE